MQRKWVNGCIWGFFFFHLRQEIEPSPSACHTRSLNSLLFSSDAKCIGTSGVFAVTTELQNFTASSQSHFKDCRGILMCEDTGVENNNNSLYLAQTFPHLYQKSLNCWRWSAMAASKWEVSKWSRAVISTNSSSAAAPQGERHPDWVAESSRLELEQISNDSVGTCCSLRLNSHLDDQKMRLSDWSVVVFGRLKFSGWAQHATPLPSHS